MDRAEQNIWVLGLRVRVRTKTAIADKNLYLAYVPDEHVNSIWAVRINEKISS